MPSNTITVGELLYEQTVHVTRATEYGISMEALVAGQVAPPPEGARFDVAFEGVLHGPKLKGTLTGVDYVTVRGDGRSQLHSHAEITTEDGTKIAFSSDGVATADESTGRLETRHNATLHTSSPEYAWVNQLQVWVQGSGEMAGGEFHLKGYAA